VTEINPDQPGSRLIVDQHHSYSDLDELIVNHVQAMSRRVEELMAHEKFKHGSEDDLRMLSFLPQWLFVSHIECRPFPQELFGCQSCQEYVWLLFEPQASWSLQPMLPGEQKLSGADLGEQTNRLSSFAHFLTFP